MFFLLIWLLFKLVWKIFLKIKSIVFVYLGVKGCVNGWKNKWVMYYFFVVKKCIKD